MMIKTFISSAIIASVFLVTPVPIQADTLSNECTSKECNRKIKKLKIFAKNGSPHAMALLGAFYFHGDEVTQNYSKAESWLYLAAKKDSPQAKYYLSLIYRDGLTGKKDIAKADRYLTSSSDAGFVLALVDKGVEAYIEHSNDYSIAYDYFTKASKLSSVKATYLLGKMTELGQGTEIDLAKAKSLYKLAATKDYRDSREHYARLANRESHSNKLVGFVSSSEIDEGIERIEVLGGNFSLETHLDFVIGDIQKQIVYNSSRTGRLRGKACDKWTNPPCATITARDVIREIVREHEVF